MFIVFLLCHILGDNYLFLRYNSLTVKTLNKTLACLHYPAVRVGNICFGVFIAGFFGRLRLTSARLFTCAVCVGFMPVYLILLSFLGLCLFLL